MALTDWHYGKLVILWLWGALLSALAWYVADGLEPASDDAFLSLLGLLALALAVLIPAGLSVVTWKWLGGKEVRHRKVPPSDDGNEHP